MRYAVVNVLFGVTPTSTKFILSLHDALPISGGVALVQATSVVVPGRLGATLVPLGLIVTEIDEYLVLEGTRLKWSYVAPTFAAMSMCVKGNDCGVPPSGVYVTVPSKNCGFTV